MPRFLYCDSCGFRLVLEHDVPTIPRCEHCGGAAWQTEKHRYILTVNDRRFLRSIKIVADDDVLEPR